MTEHLRLRTVDQHGEFEAEGDANDVIALWHDFRGVDLEAREQEREAAPAPQREEPAAEAEPVSPPSCEPESAGDDDDDALYIPSGRWTRRQIKYLERVYPDKSVPIQEISKTLGRSDHTIRIKARSLGLSRRKGRAPKNPEQASQPGGPRRRFTDKPDLNPEAVQGLPDDHPAVQEGRTLFPSTVIDPLDSPRVLVSGQHSRKLGSHVTKGRWKGFPIYQLTLEERATCPRSCHHWNTCFGSGMQLARRHRHGPGLLAALQIELSDLQEKHPGGFLVRLHVLGDFYSTEYVDCWAAWLDEFSALHVFGYTAWPLTTEIGGKVRKLAAARWDRFAVRTSAAERLEGGLDATTTWKTPEGDHTEDGALICPAQTGKTSCCGSCGLCWSENAKDTTIAFVAHGRSFRPAVKDVTPDRRVWPAEESPFEPIEPAEKAPGSFGQKLQRRCAAPGCKAIFTTSKVNDTACPACERMEAAE